MAASPKYKLYRGTRYMGCMKHVEDAAILIAAWGEGTIRISHRTRHIVWREGEEEISAKDNLKRVIQIVIEREREFNQLSFDLAYNGSGQ